MERKQDHSPRVFRHKAGRHGADAHLDPWEGDGEDRHWPTVGNNSAVPPRPETKRMPRRRRHRRRGNRWHEFTDEETE